MQVGLATTKQEFLKECEVAPGISLIPPDFVVGGMKAEK